jgi:hypothetical protein
VRRRKLDVDEACRHVGNEPRQHEAPLAADAEPCLERLPRLRDTRRIRRLTRAERHDTRVLRARPRHRDMANAKHRSRLDRERHERRAARAERDARIVDLRSKIATRHERLLEHRAIARQRREIDEVTSLRRQHIPQRRERQPAPIERHAPDLLRPNPDDARARPRLRLRLGQVPDDGPRADDDEREEEEERTHARDKCNGRATPK